MSVRKRTWTNRDGSQGEAWVVNYTDRRGVRRLKSFDRKRDAESFEIAVAGEVRVGLHVPDSQSIMVAEAARLWLDSCEAAGLERTTLAPYRQHVDLHIVPLIGAVKISQLSVPMVRAFEDALRKGRSPAMVRKVRGSLGAILADAQERGLVGQNVVRALRANRRGKEARADKRQGKLKVGVDIPSPDEIRAFVGVLDGRWRPLLLMAIHVRQRADHFNAIGHLKSESGERTVPMPPMVVSMLREHRIACPKGELGLVFPNGKGRVENYSNIVKRGLLPLMVAAGITDANGDAKYTGLHSLRHFYASWCINRRVDGGLELPLKVVQARLGHASIQMTADTYGHMFPRGDDGAELAAAEKAFLRN
jgi:integrase